MREHFGTEYDVVPGQHVAQGDATGIAVAVVTATPVLDRAFALHNGDVLFAPAGITDRFDSDPPLACTMWMIRRATASSLPIAIA